MEVNWLDPGHKINLNQWRGNDSLEKNYGWHVGNMERRCGEKVGADLNWEAYSD